MENHSFDAWDRELAEKLQDSLPDKMFDAHAHPYFKAQLDPDFVRVRKELTDEGGIAVWKERIGLQVGTKRLKGGLFFGFPLFRGDDSLLPTIREGNRFIFKELENAQDLERRGMLMISGAMRAEDVLPLLDSPVVAGFKPYVYLTPGCDFETAEIPEYLPEWALELADRKGLAITLHMAKTKALADPGNRSQIMRICKTYPGLKLILAHCGCAFNFYNAAEGMKELPAFDNLWFDCSAICEPYGIAAVLKKYGAKRLMWGTDYPISIRKGRIVALGGACHSIQDSTAAGGDLPPQSVRIGLESMRALLYAIDECGLPESAKEDIFYHNAAGLLGLGGK